MSTDSKIVKFDAQKYIDALDELIGADHAYFSGDPQIDAIVEVIMIAKEYETVIDDLYAKNQSLKIENTMFKQQALAENKTTATAIKAEHEQHLRTAEYIKRLKEENERLELQIDGIKEANSILRNNNEIAINNAISEFAEKVKAENYDDCIDVTYDGSGEVKRVELRKALFNKCIDNLICLR